MNQPVRVGLVGVGGYGQRHLTTARTLSGCGPYDLVAVADPFASKLPETVAALRADGVEIYDDIAQLCERDDIEAIIIATPIPLHASQALTALNAGKHVYLEKPPCVTLEEFEALRAARKEGQVCAIGFQMQTLPAGRFLKKQLIDGAVGKPYVVSASVRWPRHDGYYARAPWSGKWRFNGAPAFDGPATNALAHAVHGALNLAGDSQSEWAKIRRVRGCLKKARPMESYDAAYLEAETASGVLVRLALIHSSAEHDAVVLRCSGLEEGSRDKAATLDWSGRVTLPTNGGGNEAYAFQSDPNIAVVFDFLTAIRQPNHRPATDLDDGLAYLQIVNGALQSSGGAAPFASELVSRYSSQTDHGYTVAGIDEQMQAFAADPQAIPALLTPGEWIDVDAIRPQLIV